MTDNNDSAQTLLLRIFYVLRNSRNADCDECLKGVTTGCLHRLHHRGFNYLSEDDNRQIYIQVAAEIAYPYDDLFMDDHYEVEADVPKLAKQGNAVGWLSFQLGNSAFGAIQKFPRVNLPGSILASYAWNDPAIMLIEIVGQTHTLANGCLAKTAKDSLLAILVLLADGQSTISFRRFAMPT